MDDESEYTVVRRVLLLKVQVHNTVWRLNILTNILVESLNLYIKFPEQYLIKAYIFYITVPTINSAIFSLSY